MHMDIVPTNPLTQHNIAPHETQRFINVSSILEIGGHYE